MYNQGAIREAFLSSYYGVSEYFQAPKLIIFLIRNVLEFKELFRRIGAISVIQITWNFLDLC